MADGYDPTANVWHIMTRTHGGTVSLIKNLDEAAARQMMQRMPGEHNPYTDRALRTWAADTVAREEREARRVAGERHTYRFIGGSCASVSDHDFVRIDCFGPDGVDLVVWPVPENADALRAAALDAARAAADEAKEGADHG